MGFSRGPRHVVENKSILQGCKGNRGLDLCAETLQSRCNARRLCGSVMGPKFRTALVCMAVLLNSGLPYLSIMGRGLMHLALWLPAGAPLLFQQWQARQQLSSSAVLALPGRNL